ncbi:MFS transporter [Devosia riboflavina]
MTAPAQALSSRPDRIVGIGAVFLAVLPLSTDIVLVALPVIAGSFGTALAGGHQIMSVFVIGLAVAHLFVGALADRLGRRPVALVGFGLYTLASLAAMVAPSFEALLAARFVQGLSGACGPILMRALVRDTVAPAAASRRLALTGTISGIAPLLAPTVGILVAQAFGWQSSFAVLALYGAATFVLILWLMPETLATRSTAVSYITPDIVRRLFTERGFVFGSFAMAMGYGGLFSWISTGSYYLTTRTGLDPLVTSLIFAAGSLCFMLGGLVAMRLRGAPEQTIRIGAAIGATGGLLALVLALAMPDQPWFCLPIMLFYCSWGIVQPPSINIAMRDHPAIAGKASALLGLVQLGGGVVLSWIVVALGAGPYALGLMLFSTAAILLASHFAKRPQA